MRLAMIGFLPAYTWLISRDAAHSSNPWTTSEFETELDALSLWSDGIPPLDLVMLDGKPAAMTASEVVQCLRQLPRGENLRIAVFDPMPGEIHQLESSGAICCTHDGFDPEVVKALLQRVERRAEGEFAAAQCSCAVRATALLSSDDMESLREIFQTSLWQLTPAADLNALRRQLGSSEPGVVITSPDLACGATWRDVVELCGATKVIVAASGPRRQLWAEALSLGAWDILSTPFVAAEVRRMIPSAWRAYQAPVQRPHARTERRVQSLAAC